MDRRLGDRGLPPTAVEQPARRQVLLDATSPAAVGVEIEPTLFAACDELGERRHHVERGGLGHPELLFDGPAGDLDRDIHSGAAVRFVLGELLDP